MLLRQLILCILLPVSLPASEKKTEPPKAEALAATEEYGAESERTELNLLGRTDTEGGESSRNENVQFDLIDNNALKELNQRIGATAIIVEEFRADRVWFGSEFGTSLPGPLHLNKTSARPFHGNLFYSHSNSLFQARSFFQVGDVKPARVNHYGFTLGAPLWRGAVLSVDGNQQKIRGNVNGNVLVPAADERTPLTDDPQLRPVVERYLAAYPTELPNRTDINPRALNANSLQRVDDNSITALLDQAHGSRDRFVLQYKFTSQQVNAFELVAGQNPDTTTKAHTARATWNRQWTASTVSNLTAGFDRVGSLLVPEENAVGPLVIVGRSLESLGPSSSIPIDRVQNRYRFTGAVEQVRGTHSWYSGFEASRLQLNGYESSSHRGTLSFSSDFGHDAITNFRLGTPSRLTGSIGNVSRGFRNWIYGLFAGDNWRARPGLAFYYGIRYEPVTRPWEVNGFNETPYGCQCTSVAPRAGFARTLPGSWGLLRGSYGLHFGEIAPVTFGQLRFNPPYNSKFEIRLPDLRVPISKLMREAANPTGRNTIYDLVRDLGTPYVHTYNLRWELFPNRRWRLHLGYVGSRARNLIHLWTFNRARDIEGLPPTTENVNERRPDPRYFEIRRTLNGSRAWFDAARMDLLLPRYHGLTLETSYWFSKAMDLGGSYTSTATGTDARESQSQAEGGVHPDLKGPSPFHQPHSLLARATYDLEAVAPATGWARLLVGGWRVGVVALAKTGTPFTLFSGSDGPGFGNVDGTRGDRPNVVDPSVLGATVGHPDTSQDLLPQSAFAFIEGTEPSGNLGRNTFRKGRIANVNAMLSRSFPVSSERELEFRAESVNLLNTPQFAEPGRYLTSPDFGFITNTLNDGRSFRFLLQFAF